MLFAILGFIVDLNRLRHRHRDDEVSTAAKSLVLPWASDGEKICGPHEARGTARIKQTLTRI